MTSKNAATEKPSASATHFDPESIDCPEEALRLANQIASMLCTAKAASNPDQFQIQHFGQLHQQFLSRRRELKLKGKGPRPIRDGYQPGPSARTLTVWRSESLGRGVPLAEMQTLAPLDRVMLRAELRDVIRSVTTYLDRADIDGTPRGFSAAKKRSIAVIFLEALECLMENDAPPAQLAEVFQQVARNSLDSVTYQRLLLLAQQRLQLDRQQRIHSASGGDATP
jgi:hypothetical protein